MSTETLIQELFLTVEAHRMKEAELIEKIRRRTASKPVGKRQARKVAVATQASEKMNKNLLKKLGKNQ